MIILGLLTVVLALWAAHELRGRFFPAPVPWTVDDEGAAARVAETFGVTIEEARLAVIAWRR